MGKDIAAIVCSDIHLSSKPPFARSAEPDWWAAMKRPLDEIQGLMNQYDCPLIVAGDVTNKWKEPTSELVNFAIAHLPKCYAVAGNHDLPYHDYNQLHKSAYYTLMLSGKIINLEPHKPITTHNLILHGFPFGVSLTPCPEPTKEFALNVAVVHAYIWIAGKGYEGAPEDKRLGKYRKALTGYDTSVWGDNHSGFLVEGKPGKCSVFNGGTLLRRRMDERSYKPHVGLLRADGTITPHYLDCSQDKFAEPEAIRIQGEEIDLGEFLEGLNHLGDSGTNYHVAVNRALDEKKVHGPLRKRILETLEIK